MNKIVVNKGGTVCVKNPRTRERHVFGPNAVLVVDQHVSLSMAQELLKSGYARLQGSPEPRDPGGYVEQQALPSDVDASKFVEGKGPNPIKSEIQKDVASKAQDVAEEAKALTKKRGQKKAPVSPWVMDPDGLKGRDVVELNVMALEKGYKGPEFPDQASAIAFLSQDAEK